MLLAVPGGFAGFCSAGLGMTKMRRSRACFAIDRIEGSVNVGRTVALLVVGAGLAADCGRSAGEEFVRSGNADALKQEETMSSFRDGLQLHRRPNPEPSAFRTWSKRRWVAGSVPSADGPGMTREKASYVFHG